MHLPRLSPTPLLVGLALAGLGGPFLLARLRRGTRSVMTGKGWTTKAGVVLSDRVGDWLDTLTNQLPFAIVITSGTRSADAQARALLSKLERGQTFDDLHALYAQDDLIDELEQAPQTEAAFTTVLAGQVERGRYLSRHMRADAIDIRTTGGPPGTLTPEQVWQVMSTAQTLQVEAIDEGDHIHLEGIPV